MLRVIPRGHYREVLLQSHGTQLRSFTDTDPQPEQVVGVRAARALVYADDVLVDDVLVEDAKPPRRNTYRPASVPAR